MSVAARRELELTRTRSDGWATALGALLALALVAAAGEIVIDAGRGHSPLIPKSPAIAGYLSGIGERLGYRVFLIALLAFTVAYAGLLALARRRARVAARARDDVAGERAWRPWAIALVAVLQLLVFAGPILISTDVFSYIAYARMGVIHGVNPYLHGPDAIAGDPVLRYVGLDWRHVATAYGPLYTLLSYPLAPLGLVAALWAMKVYALAASAITLALTWWVAGRRGHDRVFALLAVGANPLYVIYGLGGAHNDLIMLALMMAAVAFATQRPDGRRRGRAAAAGAMAVMGGLVKVTVAVLLPFMVLAQRRLAALVGALGALALAALAGYLAFGVHGLDVIAALNRDSALVSTDSIPTELAHLFGKPGVFPVDHDLFKAALAIVLAHLLWRTWRGYDWVAASGWALLAIAVTSTWLLPWYILWPLPLAVVTRDRRLLAATLCVQGLFIIHQTPPLFAPVL